MVLNLPFLVRTVLGARPAFALLLFGTLLTSGCTKKSEGPTLWIYTSLYNHVVQDLDLKLKNKFPGVTFRWYQSGSENVAAKVNAEILAGRPQADLILTSDPFWYEDLKAQKKLMSYRPAQSEGVPSNLKDPDGYYTTARVPLMVIAYHSDVFDASRAPKGYVDLLDSRFKNQISMGNPLESGTVFTSVALLSQKLGWDYFSKLRAQGIVAAGGNSTVVSRIETKERPVGIALLENVLATQRRNPKIQFVIPVEGAILIPSPVGILASTPFPKVAQEVADFLFSKEGQDSIIQKGDMHSPLPGMASPQGAPVWEFVQAHSMTWNPQILAAVYKERTGIKKQFSAKVLE